MRHINRYPRQGMRLTLMLLPFVLMIAAWFIGSAVRLEANPQDKLLPGLSQMIAAIDRMAFTPDKRSGEYLLWADTLISMSRLLIGLALSSLIGLGIGIAAGVFPMYRAALSPLMTVVSMIPPLAILPVLMFFLLILKNFHTFICSLYCKSFRYQKVSCVAISYFKDFSFFSYFFNIIQQDDFHFLQPPRYTG